MGDASPEALSQAYDLREAAFEVLKSAIESGESLDAAGRAHVARVRELDAALVEAGAALSESTRGERQDLQRARSVIQAHAARERDQPRLVAVKA